MCFARDLKLRGEPGGSVDNSREGSIKVIVTCVTSSNSHVKIGCRTLSLPSGLALSATLLAAG
jgi:hypothetical protein